MKYLYICGRGHSGTTALDILLSNINNWTGIGEIVAGLSRYRNEACACGKVINSCEHWAINYKGENPLSSSEIMTFSESFHIKHLVRYLTTRPAKLINIESKMHEHLLKIRNKAVLVDSSKEISRAAFLLKNFTDARILHVIKDPLHVFESNYKRYRKGEQLKFLRISFKPNWIMFFIYSIVLTLSWNLGFILTRFIRLIDKKRYYLLNVDQLKANNPAVIERLETFLGVTKGEIGQKLKENLPIGHRIGGNRVSKNGSFLKYRQLSPSVKLPLFYKLLVIFFNYPIWLLYKNV